MSRHVVRQHPSIHRHSVQKQSAHPRATVHRRFSSMKPSTEREYNETKSLVAWNSKRYRTAIKAQQPPSHAHAKQV